MVTRKGWQYKTNNKMRGALGSTDLDKKVITINKKKHKDRRLMKSVPKKQRSLINTIVHERMHAKHPKMKEKAVRRKSVAAVARMGAKAKRRAYKLFSYPTKRK